MQRCFWILETFFVFAVELGKCRVTFIPQIQWVNKNLVFGSLNSEWKLETTNVLNLINIFNKATLPFIDSASNRV